MSAIAGIDVVLTLAVMQRATVPLAALVAMTWLLICVVEALARISRYETHATFPLLTQDAFMEIPIATGDGSNAILVLFYLDSSEADMARTLWRGIHRTLCQTLRPSTPVAPMREHLLALLLFDVTEDAARALINCVQTQASAVASDAVPRRARVLAAMTLVDRHGGLHGALGEALTSIEVKRHSR